MKKILLVVLAAAAGIFAKKRMDAANKEQALWHEATDNVNKA
ncbi:MAG: DLW-39 family protein [Actinomycetota bacterium]|nr:DLW-39 family protein [Actinomycetota bacterium]